MHIGLTGLITNLWTQMILQVSWICYDLQSHPGYAIRLPTVKLQSRHRTSGLTSLQDDRLPAEDRRTARRNSISFWGLGWQQQKRGEQEKSGYSIIKHVCWLTNQLTN